MSIIPDGLKELYEQYADEMINNTMIGVDCELIYQPKIVVCPNCDGTKSIYNGTGPMPFDNGLCPYCAGEGKIEEPQSEIVRMRVYQERKAWLRYFNSLEVPDADALTITFLENLPKIRQAVKAVLVRDAKNFIRYEFTLMGEPFPHGFGKDRYLMAWWKRA